MQSAECSEQTKTVNNRFCRSAAARGCKKSVDNGFPPSVTEPQRDANAQKQGAIRVECIETRSATMFQELMQNLKRTRNSRPFLFFIISEQLFRSVIIYNLNVIKQAVIVGYVHCVPLLLTAAEIEVAKLIAGVKCILDLADCRRNDYGVH